MSPQARNLLIAAAVIVVLIGGIALAQQTIPATDSGFITDALKGDNSEIALGQIAIDKGTSQAVRDLGQALVTDHSKAKQDVLALAQKLNVQPTDEMTPAAQREQQRLQQLTGPDFDKEFADYMTDDHKSDIAKFEKQARAGSPETADLARRTLPTLQKHLQMAQSLPGGNT